MRSLLPTSVAPRPLAHPRRCFCSFSLTERLVSKGAVVVVGSRWRAGCSFLFRRSGHRRVFVGAASASQFHAGPSGGQKAAGACRDGGGVGRASTRRRERLLT